MAIFWLWLLLGAAAFVAGMFDSPTKLFLAMYAGAVAVLVSIPIGVLSAIFMLLNRPAAQDRRPAADRLSSAASYVRSAVAAVPWAAAAGRAKELGGKLGPAANSLGTTAKAGVGRLRSGAGQLRRDGDTPPAGRQPDATEHRRPVKRLPSRQGPIQQQPGDREPSALRQPPAPRRPPVPPRRPSAPPTVHRSDLADRDSRDVFDVDELAS
ncbi:hypothetical protein ACMX2H_18715 [Arthrobacter sulfonylureivorans]|uniref:hypothetical protein n=1 Tax=Arthrobacter sulfonylureivorans TaxID=2486855 RepID=UPI0039E6DDC9